MRFLRSSEAATSWLRKSDRIRLVVASPTAMANAQRMTQVRPAEISARRQRIEMRSSTQDVPRAADRVQEPGLATRLELAAEVRHEDLDRVRGGERVVAPDLFEEALARHDDPLVAHQVLEQLELALRQLDHAIATRDLVRVRVQREVGDDQRGGAARRAAPQQGAQPGQQLLALEGLDEVVVGARVEPLHAGLDRVARSQHQDRDVVGAADLLGDLDPVDLRQPEAEDDHVGDVFGVHGERLLAVQRDPDLVALQAQRALEHLRDLVVVLHDKDACRSFCAHCRGDRRGCASREGELHPRVEARSPGMPPAKKAPAKKRTTAARSKARPKPRARRSGGWRQQLPVLEQHHIDLMGLALVAAGIFLVFPLWMGWDGGRGGEGLVEGLRYLVGVLAYGAPGALCAIGALCVLRPVLPAVRPFRAGGICLVAALTLALAAGTLGLGPAGVRHGFWHTDFLSDRGGIVGEALFYGSSNLIGNVGAHILAIFLFVAALLLLTGASIAGVVRATATVTADTTRALRRTEAELRRAKPAPLPREMPAEFLPPEPDDTEPIVHATHVEVRIPEPEIEEEPPELAEDEPDTK